jgi:YD repeat-containing protein
LKEDDGDSDGMPTWWEVFHGLNPLDANDAKGDLDSDAVDNLMEFRLETMPTKSDTDGDGVNDGEELALYGTNPRLADTDGDGMPDKWEIEHGLDPRRKDAIEDRDFDFLTNLDEFQAGTKPNNWDSDSNGVPDFLQTRGKIAWAADYDRNDRLISVRYEQQSFGFRYDGNGNLIGQSRLGRDGDGDGLPDSWEYAHGLNPFSAVGNDGAAGDPDGDGWTNLQEWTARTNPRDSNIRPGANGAAVATFDVPFTPTRFVSATGQFDGSIGDEFVVGADGAPGSQSNFVRIYSEIGGWTYEQVDVGAFGVTSIVVGQVSGRPRAIYLGLRRSGGGGRVVELRKEGSVWQLTTLAESQSDAAYVHGIADVAGSGELLLSLVSRLSANFGLFRASYAQNYWRVGLLDATDGVVAAGAMGGRIGLSNTESRLFRSIKSGGISLSRLAPHVAFDDFATTTLDSTSWSSGGSKGGASGVHSFSVSVTDGKARVFAAWDDNSGDRHGYAFLETQALWAAGERGLEIAISQAASSGPGPSPSATIRLGTTQIYSLVPGQIFANVRLQLVRTDSEVYFRSGSAQLGWSNWAAAPSSSTLRFETGSTTDFNVEGSAELLIDSIRYLPIGTLAEAGVGPTDFITPNAAYRTATQKWYFKTPSALSWVDAQAYAAARQGDLVTVESAPTNTWLAGWANGEVWIGYMRDFSTSPWRWLGGNPSSYTSWGSGQPGTGTNQIFALANAGAWSSAAGTEVKAAVFESRAQALEVRTSTITQALGSRLAWAGRTLQAGAFVANDAALQSIVEAYVEDRDGTNTLTFGDEFVVAESVVGTAQSQPRTLVRRSVAPTGPALGFALAGVRLAGATNDTLITAEPDGQLVAWHPTPAGTEMRRQLLSAQQIGRVWHSLEKIAAGYSGDGLLGLVVSPSLPQRAEIVLVGGAELSDGSNTFLAQTEPSARIMTTPSSGGAVARLDVRVWDSESSPVRLFVQYQSTANGPWLDATLSTVNNLPAVSATALATAPGGVVHQATWNAGANLGATFRGNVSLRVRAADATAVGAWSDSVIYSIDGAGDTDGDGILDAYEDANGLNRLANDANLDLDGDGIGNLDEYLQGTAPNNAGSAKYSLTVSGVGATVSKNPDQVLYDTGTTVNVTATQQPATLSFIGWAPTAPLAGGGFAAALTANPLPVLMNAHKSVTAYAGLPLAAAVETPSLTWTTGGHTLWYGQSSTTHDGLDAVQATGLGASGNEAWMETTVTAPGSISWRAKLELAAGGGAALQVLVSDTVVDTTSVSGDWAAKIVAVNGAGATKVRWRFVRQAVNAAAVNDSAFVDTVAYVAAAKPVITTQPQDLAVGVGGNAGFSVIATSETPLSYRWQRKTAAQAEFADLNTAS